MCAHSLKAQIIMQAGCYNAVLRVAIGQGHLFPAAGTWREHYFPNWQIQETGGERGRVVKLLLFFVRKRGQFCQRSTKKHAFDARWGGTEHGARGKWEKMVKNGGKGGKTWGNAGKCWWMASQACGIALHVLVCCAVECSVYSYYLFYIEGADRAVRRAVRRQPRAHNICSHQKLLKRGQCALYAMVG